MTSPIILAALCRPYKEHGRSASPASDEQIAPFLRQHGVQVIRA